MRDAHSSVATKEQLDSRSRDVEWYEKDLEKVPDAARDVLERYSKIPSDRLREHVYAIVCVRRTHNVACVDPKLTRDSARKHGICGRTRALEAFASLI